MTNFRWLLVGAGDIARKRVAPALFSTAGSEITAVCDLRETHAHTLAQDFGAEHVFTDYEQALDCAPVDGVYLAVPVHLHVPQAIRALQAGKHVLIEKPLSVTVGDGNQLVEAAQRSHVTAGCAYFRRLFPAYRFTKEMLSQGEFGSVLMGNIAYHSWFQPQPDDPKYWRVQRAYSGGGPLSDMGSHMLDVLIGLLGMPVSVFARCDNLLTSWDVEDTTSLVMKMEGGALVTASLSWCSRTWKHEFELVGSEARVIWTPYDSGTMIRLIGRTTETLNLPPAANVHQPLVEDFIQSVREGREPVCPISEAAKTGVLLYAIYRSSLTKAEVEIYP